MSIAEKLLIFSKSCGIKCDLLKIEIFIVATTFVIKAMGYFTILDDKKIQMIISYPY